MGARSGWLSLSPWRHEIKKLHWEAPPRACDEARLTPTSHLVDIVHEVLGAPLPCVLQLGLQPRHRTRQRAMAALGSPGAVQVLCRGLGSLRFDRCPRDRVARTFPLTLHGSPGAPSTLLGSRLWMLFIFITSPTSLHRGLHVLAAPATSPLLLSPRGGPKLKLVRSNAIQSCEIGARRRVFMFCHILRNARITIIAGSRNS